jgi:NAD(P)-dependent dehydrogenase (short-subunit alcohol dehydrogenase family)
VRLEGRLAVVTGAAAGIGRATARALAAEGAAVVAIDREQAANAALVDELRADGSEAEAIALDLADGDAVRRVAGDLVSRRPVVDVLVNNAGLVAFEPLDAYTEAHWDEMVDVNLRSAVQLTRGLLPALRRSAGASIVNNASVDGLHGHPHAPVYSVAKAGLIGLTRSAAYELGGDGIRVNAVAPGGIETAMTRSARFPVRFRDEVARLTPLRRFGAPEEVARAIVFLASDDASFITGEVLTVDGGRTALTGGTLGPR